LILALVCFALSYSCGSGTDQLSASGGVGGTGVTIGEVSQYGSIFVNGVEFDTQAAEIFVEGAPAGSGDQAVRDHLPLGQQVVIQGDFTGERSGTALRVDGFYRVLGPVQSAPQIDDDSIEFTVLGQTIYVDRQTQLAGVTLVTLTQGMMLRVSGPVDAQGAVHAGLITRVLAMDGVVGVKGRVESLNAQQESFRINGLTVQYGDIQGPTAILTQDQMVAVEGTLEDDELQATQVEWFQTESIASADEFLIDGFITVSDTQNQWRMGEYQVRLGSGTRFEDISPEDLMAGARIKVRGRLQDRLLQADQVEAATAVRLESRVTTVDGTTRTLTLEGMGAIAIRVNRLTRVHGSISDLSQIATGDHVRVLGFAVDDRMVAASAISGDRAAPQNNRFILHGPVTLISEPRFAILGVEVDTAANEGITFWGNDLQSLSVEEFFATLADGLRVRVSGRWEEDELIYETMAIVP
jgi:hypothetical protein